MSQEHVWLIEDADALRCRLMNYITTPEEADLYINQLLDLINSGKLKINVHKLYPFTAEGVQQSQRDLTEGKTTGKLLIKMFLLFINSL